MRHKEGRTGACIRQLPAFSTTALVHDDESMRRWFAFGCCNLCQIQLFDRVVWKKGGSISSFVVVAV